MSKEEVKEKIIQAAMKVFAQYGYFRAPVKLVAIEAGVSKGLIFWYFRNKDELIKEVAIRALPSDIIKKCLNASLIGKELLQCIGNNYLKKYSDNYMRLLLLNTLALATNYPSISSAMAEACGSLLTEVAEKVYGKRTKENIVRFRAFFGALQCHTINPSKEINAKDYLNILIKLFNSSPNL